MSDQPFYAPARKPATPRQRQPGEHLWSVQKDGQQLECELRDHDAWSAEVQIYRDGEFLYGRRWPSRALALEGADDQKAAYLKNGEALDGRRESDT
jgi:hypothetical protein